jgi:hypothetical protein
MADRLLEPKVASRQREQVAALVRAIRRAYGSQSVYRGVEAFHVSNVHDFARRLVAEGVRTEEPRALSQIGPWMSHSGPSHTPAPDVSSTYSIVSLYLTRQLTVRLYKGRDN